jgi:hypothetical protein
MIEPTSRLSGDVGAVSRSRRGPGAGPTTVRDDAVAELQPILASVDDGRATPLDAALLYLTIMRRPATGRDDRGVEAERATEEQAEAIAGVIVRVLRSLDLPEEAERAGCAVAATELRRLEAGAVGIVARSDPHDYEIVVGLG